MTTDTDLERRLRDELHARSLPDPLPDRVLVDSLALGHRALHRRRRSGALAIGAVLVVVSGLVAVGVQRGGDPPQPTPSPPRVTPTPQPDSIAPGAWVDGLPQGAPPSVPYLAGTTVVQPDGTRVDTGGTGAGVIGLTVAGLVLLVETEREHPYSLSSRYVLVTDDGELRDLPASTLTAGSAQEAVISPDDRLFTSGSEIYDITDLSVVGEVPDEADILFVWTPEGIFYGAGPRTYLWPVGGQPRAVELPGAFLDGTDVGLDGCQAVRLAADGTATPISECLRGLWAVSPTGRWALTDDLRLVDLATDEARFLAGASVQPVPDAYDKVWWDGDDSLLFPIGAHLVRCDTATASCERATDGTELTEGRLALP